MFLTEFRNVLDVERYKEFLQFWKGLESKTAVDYLIYSLLRGRTSSVCFNFSKKTGKTSARLAVIAVQHYKVRYNQRNPRSCETIKFMTDGEFERFLDNLGTIGEKGSIFASDFRY